MEKTFKESWVGMESVLLLFEWSFFSEMSADDDDGFIELFDFVAVCEGGE